MKHHSDMSGGFTLVEVTLALGVAAFCLLSVFGLLSVGFNSNQSSSQETEACGLLSSIIADLNACPKTSPPGQQTTTVAYSIAIPANPVVQQTQTELFFNADGQWSSAAGPEARYRVVIGFRPNGTASRAATLVNLSITWPAAAAKSSGSVETLIALDRN